jgi:DNA-binding response OmpR family regulator
MKTITLTLTKQLEDKFTSKLKKDKLTDSEYILKLIENDLDSTIKLGEGFYYHRQSDKLYDKENKEIPLTKIEKGILLTLIANEGDITPVDIIIQKAWKKDNVSIYSFRNVVLKIREKTYYKLIKNHSNLGYSINM